jgi:hypothetical protein
MLRSSGMSDSDLRDLVQEVALAEQVLQDALAVLAAEAEEAGALQRVSTARAREAAAAQQAQHAALSVQMSRPRRTVDVRTAEMIAHALRHNPTEDDFPFAEAAEWEEHISRHSGEKFWVHTPTGAFVIGRSSPAPS